MTEKRQIDSIAELYAHALAVEREAAARYAELAGFMADHDNAPVADLFARLAQIEEEHADAIVARARELDLPALEPSEHTWFDAGPPETVAHEFVFRLMTPHDALKVALDAERRAHAYFEQVFAAATDPGLKMLAASMIQEEQQHIDWVERALAADPDPNIDWERLFAHRRVVLPPGPGVEVRVRSARPKAKKGAAKKRAAKKTAPRKSGKKKPVARRSAPKKKSASKRKPAAKKKAARRR
ncbi:MAG TPA: ferritin family protein [Burkholderiales bacterium]|nr:ferritin family protein [Burkholderiales bacterium]